MASVGGHGNPAVLWLARLEEVIQLTIRMGVLPWAQGGKGQWEALAGHALRATKLGLFGVTSVCVCGAGKHRRCRRTRLLYREFDGTIKCKPLWAPIVCSAKVQGVTGENLCDRRRLCRPRLSGLLL